MVVFQFPEIVLVAIALLVGFWLFRSKRNSRYPPGPISIPFLGNVLQLRKNPLQVFQTWAEKYGAIYSIRLGTQDPFIPRSVIVVNDPKLVKELFSDNNSTGRAFNPVTYYVGRGSGIINCQGRAWEEQRSFTVRKLRDFGVLNHSNANFLMEEAETLVKYFERRVGEPIPGTKLFNGPVVNGLWRIVSGEISNWDSKDKSEILKKAKSIIESINKASLLFFAPFLRHVAPKYFGWTDWTNAVDSLDELTEKEVEKHSNQLDPNNPQDFIDEYLIKIRKTTDPTSSFYKDIGVKNLKAVVFDLFGAGSETSSLTLSFATLYLLLNKEAQQNAQSELDRVVGSSRQVSLSDRRLLPYTEAIIQETLRLSSIAPLGFPHRMTADTIFHGYLLPKDVTVFAGLYTIHHDPKIWGKDVNEFRPERFLNDDKTRVVHHEALMPFGSGKRIYLGESFAKDSLFIFIASILQNFNIEPDPVCPVWEAETLSGFAVEPKPFKFVLTLRN